MKVIIVLVLFIYHKGMSRVMIGRIAVRVPARARNVSLFRIVRAGSGIHPASYKMGAETLSPGEGGTTAVT